MPEVGAVRGAQAHGEVGVQAHVDGGLVVGEALHQGVRHRDDGALGDEGAGGAVGVVLERLRHRRAVVPAGEHPDVRAVRGGGLGHHGELRVEGVRKAADQGAQELLADLAGGALGQRPEQVAPARTDARRRRLGR